MRLRFVSNFSISRRRSATHFPAVALNEILEEVRSYLRVDSMISGKLTVRYTTFYNTSRGVEIRNKADLREM
jgi:hypothetical protein